MVMPNLTPRSESTPYLAWGYLRVSTARQWKKGQSLSVEQPERIAEYYTRVLLPEGVGWGGLFTERPVSARRIMFRDRAEGRELFASVKKGDHVIVDSLSRAFRNMRDICNTIHDLEAMGVTTHFRDIGVDIRTPAGRSLMYSLGIAAEIFSSILSERVKEWHASKKARGIKENPQPPLGKMVAKGVASTTRLVPNYTEEEIVKRVLIGRDVERLSWPKVADFVNRGIYALNGIALKGRGRWDERLVTERTVQLIYKRAKAEKEVQAIADERWRGAAG